MEMLKESLNWDEIYKQPRRARGHTEIMDVLFKDAKVVCSYVEESARGDLAYIYKLNKEYIIVNDYFGSCYSCDIYAQANDTELKNLCVQLANNAYRFGTMKELFRFLNSIEEQGEYYDMFEIAEGLLNELINNRKVLRTWKLNQILDT